MKPATALLLLRQNIQRQGKGRALICRPTSVCGTRMQRHARCTVQPEREQERGHQRDLVQKRRCLGTFTVRPFEPASLSLKKKNDKHKEVNSDTNLTDVAKHHTFTSVTKWLLRNQESTILFAHNLNGDLLNVAIESWLCPHAFTVCSRQSHGFFSPQYFFFFQNEISRKIPHQRKLMCDCVHARLSCCVARQLGHIPRMQRVRPACLLRLMTCLSLRCRSSGVAARARRGRDSDPSAGSLQTPAE